MTAAYRCTRTVDSDWVTSASVVRLPLFEGTLEGVAYATAYLVEFEPHSLWFEASLTIAAQAAKQGILTDYHTFQHAPGEVRVSLTKLGLDLPKLEKNGVMRVMDSYSVATGFAASENPELYPSRSLNLRDWEAGIMAEVKGGEEGIGRRRFHVDDNTSVLLQYNDEKTFLDHERTKGIPENRALEFITFHGVIMGVHSESFYRQFESLCDGIIDFHSREEKGRIEHYMRVRSLRGRQIDSRWRHLRLQVSGEVTVEKILTKSQELGVTGWLKGERKID